MAMRAHVVLPEELVKEVDAIMGKRGRSRFIEEAIRDKLAREKLGRALRDTAGILDPADYPEWDTSEKVSAWVRESRRVDNEHLERKLKRWQEVEE